MPFLLTLLAAKGLGALVAGIVLLTRTFPGFAAPVLRVENDTLLVRTTLSHGFNKNLDQLLESGSNVAVGYTVVLLSRGQTEPLAAAEPVAFFHSAVYNPADRLFTVYRSELTNGPDSLVAVATLGEAKTLLADVRCPLVPLADLPKDREFACRVEAALNTIRLEAMDGREFDLNTFWNYRYPRGITPWLRLP